MAAAFRPWDNNPLLRLFGSGFDGSIARFFNNAVGFALTYRSKGSLACLLALLM